jgi:hypothetical protein
MSSSSGSINVGVGVGEFVAVGKGVVVGRLLTEDGWVEFEVQAMRKPISNKIRTTNICLRKWLFMKYCLHL